MLSYKFVCVCLVSDGVGMQFAAVFLTIKGVQQVAADKHRGAAFSDLFTNAIFRDIVISISATVGLYVIASIIHVRPSSLCLAARASVMADDDFGAHSWIRGTCLLRSYSTP